MSANLEDPAVATGLGNLVLPIPKKGSTKECANHQTIALISHATKVMLKTLHARLQHYANQELPDVQTGFRKEEGPEIKMPTFAESKRKLGIKKNYFCFIDYGKAFVWITTNWKILKETGMPDHLTCLLRNLYAGKEATVRTLYGITNLFKIEKGIQQGCLLSPCLFNIYAEHILRNAGLNELQPGIKIRREKYQQPQI